MPAWAVRSKPKNFRGIPLQDSEKNATISFDNGERLNIAFQQPEGRPELVGEAIAQHLR
jgi:hypothetical protein